MLRAMAVCAWVVLLAGVSVGRAEVLSFDDLASDYVLTGSNYGGLTWEAGNAGYMGTPGLWKMPAIKRYPHSGLGSISNINGSTQIGIGFGIPMYVQGAYIAGQGDALSWTTGLRVLGYRDGALVGTTPWFTNIDTSPDWLAMNFGRVDRIVFESLPVNLGGGWFGMDDLTYSATPEPASLAMLALGGLFLRRRALRAAGR